MKGDGPRRRTEPPISGTGVQGDLRPGPGKRDARRETRPVGEKTILAVPPVERQHPFRLAHGQEFAIPVFEHLFDARKGQTVLFREIGEATVHRHPQAGSIGPHPERSGPVNQQGLHWGLLHPGQFGMGFHPSAIVDPRQATKGAHPKLALPESQGRDIQTGKPVLQQPGPIHHRPLPRFAPHEPEQARFGAGIDLPVRPFQNRDARIIQLGMVAFGIALHRAIAPEAVDAAVRGNPDIAPMIFGEMFYPRLMLRLHRTDRRQAVPVRTTSGVAAKGPLLAGDPKAALGVFQHLGHF